MRALLVLRPTSVFAGTALILGCGSTTEQSPSPPPAPIEYAAPLPTPEAGAAAPLLSPGCAVAPALVGTFSEKATTAHGKRRAYHLSVPTGLGKNEPLPLLFVFHGAGDDHPERMREWFAVEAAMPRALVVYPQALTRTRPDGSGGGVARWDLSGDEDLAFFDALLSEASSTYCVDPAHVFVTGFSSGGNFSQQLACLRQKVVKGMAVVAGPGPFESSCDGEVPVWITHDADDTTLPVKDARRSRDFWTKQDGCGATWTPLPGRAECTRNASCAGASSVVYCETKGVGHAVPPFAATAIGEFFGALTR